MFFTYLRRELAGRRRQTAIVAIGMALAIALVMIVNSVASGVRDAQASVLESVYGVGTDLTVSQEPTPARGGRGRRGARPLRVRRRRRHDDRRLDRDQPVPPHRRVRQHAPSTRPRSTRCRRRRRRRGIRCALAHEHDVRRRDAAVRAAGPGRAARRGRHDAAAAPGRRLRRRGRQRLRREQLHGARHRPRRRGASARSRRSSSPTGRGLEASDAGEAVAVLDASYATSAELAVGDTIDVGGTDFEVVGTVTSTSADAATRRRTSTSRSTSPSRSPASTARSATIYVQADVVGPDRRGAGRHRGGAARRDRVDAGRPRRLGVGIARRPHRASISNLGLWLSVAVLVAAFLIAILFTDPGRHPSHPRVRHAQGDRLVEPPRRRPGRGRVARAGPHRRCRRPRARPRRHLGDQPRRAHPRRQRDDRRHRQADRRWPAAAAAATASGPFGGPARRRGRQPRPRWC